MKIRFSLLKVRISPQKTRVVADLIRGKNVFYALKILEFLSKKSAFILLKCLKSAISNIKYNNVNIDKFKIEEINIQKATTLKRFFARAKGKSDKISKQFSNIYIILRG